MEEKCFELADGQIIQLDKKTIIDSAEILFK